MTLEGNFPPIILKAMKEKYSMGKRSITVESSLMEGIRFDCGSINGFIKATNYIAEKRNIM